MLRLVLLALLVATVLAQFDDFNPQQFRRQLRQQQRAERQRNRQGQQQNRRNFRQRQRQRQGQGGELTDSRIGLVGDQLGQLDPVPGSDYPSRVVNNNQQQNSNNNQGGFEPAYQPASPPAQNTNQNLQQAPQGRTPQNSGCSCTLQGECQYNEGFDGAGLLDIRIVNQNPTIINNQLQCTSEYQELCCPPGADLVQQPPAAQGCPAAQPRSCGQKNLIGVAGYDKKPAEAYFGAYPWVATILRGADAYVCSGVLIDNQWVLTVAHHLNKYRNNYSALKIRFGEWDASDPDHEPCRHEERYISELIIHPSFNSDNLQNDVALIRLSEPVNVNSYPHINTACLPAGGQSFDYQRCWVAGFGKDAFGQQGQYSYIQKEVDVPVVPQNDCENQLRQTRLGGAFYLDRRAFICAGGEQGKDSCEGDGGAPLVCDPGNGQWTVAGLVAWGIGCAEVNRPGVYVNVASFSDWIRGKTGVYNG